MRILIAAIAVATLAGCANPGIVRMSGDTYMLAKSNLAGAFGNPSAFKAEVIQEATAFADNQGKVAVPLSLSESGPAFGRLPSVEYQFRLVEPGHQDASGAALTPIPQSAAGGVVVLPTPVTCSSHTFGTNAQTHCR